jgi:hypothetical protein
MSKIVTFYIKLLVVLLISLTSCSNAQNNVKNDNQLIQKADSLLSIKPFSVVHKTGVPPSKNKHDYMSIGPYWRPNSNTENGLPYIRKDGEINPESRNDFTDYVEKNNFLSALKTHLVPILFKKQQINYCHLVYWGLLPFHHQKLLKENNK